MRRNIFLLVCALLLTSLFVHGGGYQVRLQGHKQTGIALIGTPFAYGSSSQFYNPGALSFVNLKYDFSLGASGIVSNHVFRKMGTDYTERTDNPLGTPFYAYGSGKINDRLSIGIGVNTPFGSSAQWPKGWAGQYLVQDISLMAIFIQPTISYKITDRIGIGAGFVYAFGNVEFNRALPYGDNSSVNLEGTGNDIGFNVGVFFKPTESLSLGIDYRSEIVMEVEGGDATFNVPVSLQGSIPPANTFSAELPLPANLDFGLAYKFNEKLTLAASVNWVMWETYDSLKFIFDENGDLLSSSSPRLYSDSWISRIGAQYDMNETFTFRAGVYYDPTPTNEDYFSPETVSLNTLAFTLGMSIRPAKGLSIDLSYLQLNGMEAEKSYAPDNFSGTYKTLTIIPGIGLSYSF